MSSFEPSRIPAWLAPVCEERSGSHSASSVAALGDPARHRRRAAVAHRVAQHRQGEPVDLEEDDPGHVGGRPARPGGGRPAGPRAACTRRRRWCRSATWSTIETAAITSAASSASPNESTPMTSGSTSSATHSATASTTSTSRKPETSVNGSRSAATSGGNDGVEDRDHRGDQERPAEVVEADARRRAPPQRIPRRRRRPMSRSDEGDAALAWSASTRPVRRRPLSRSLTARRAVHLRTVSGIAAVSPPRSRVRRLLRSRRPLPRPHRSRALDRRRRRRSASRSACWRAGSPSRAAPRSSTRRSRLPLRCPAQAPRRAP